MLIKTDQLPRPYQEVPPLRDDPFAEDASDMARVEFVRDLWASQDLFLLDRDRTIERNLRMLAGQQWSVWNDFLGRFVDLTEYFTDDERRWRFLPVINRMLHWYMLLHARMTENPPIISFEPATADRNDAELAEVMDAVHRYIWREANVSTVLQDVMAWLIPSGTTYAKSRIDPTLGDPIPMRGPATLSLLGPDGEPVWGAEGPIERDVDDVPFDLDGNPLAVLVSADEFEETGRPGMLYEGGIVVDVVSALECRGQWGPSPWWKKSWHIHKSLLTPEEVWEAWQVDVEPSVMGAEAEEGGIMRRVLRGLGFYGSAQGQGNGPLGAEPKLDEELVEVYELWQRPSSFPGMERTQEEAGGRLCIVAGDRVVRDGQRPAAFRYTSPIREFAFVKLPGRPSGTTPAEMMTGPQASYNRLTAQILQHATLAANPIKVVDTSSGIREGQLTNRPGQIAYANLNGAAADPVRFIKPANLGTDVWRSRELLRQDLNELGNIEGSEGRPPTADASGELVRELRANSDRFVGPTLRNAVEVMGRMAEDWKVLVPIIWDEPKIIRVVGEDRMATTVTVYPHLFEQGAIHVYPELTSMLPEGRMEREQRVWAMYEAGLYGPPGSPEAISLFFDQIRHPHIGRSSRPGGIDREMARQNVGKLARGVPPTQVPIFEWYDHQIHLDELHRWMKSPEYLRLSPDRMDAFVMYRLKLLQALMLAVQKGAGLQAMVQGAQVAGMAAAAAAGGPEGAPGPDDSVPGSPDTALAADAPAA